MAQKPAEEYRRLRLATLAIEREQVLEIRSSGTVDHDVIEEVLAALDVEESMLTISAQRARSWKRPNGRDAAHATGACDHLASAPFEKPPAGLEVCEDCIREVPVPSICASVSAAAGGVLRFFTRPARDPALPQQPSPQLCVASSRANPGAGAFSTSGSGELTLTGDNARASSQDGCISPRQSRLFMD